MDPALIEMSQGAVECMKVRPNACPVSDYNFTNFSKVLLENGAGSDCSDNDGMQPIHWALQCLSRCTFNPCTQINTMQCLCYNTDNLEALHILISSGADPDQQDNGGMRGTLTFSWHQLPLQWQVHGPSYDTGLHVAAKHGVTDGCQYLIEVAGVHGNVLDAYEQTALFYSTESQALHCSEYLLSIGCSANHRNNDQRR